jgi:hypothetical protein
MLPIWVKFSTGCIDGSAHYKTTGRESNHTLVRDGPTLLSSARVSNLNLMKRICYTGRDPGK